MIGSDGRWWGHLTNQIHAQRGTEVHRGGNKNQDFMIIRLVNANDLIDHGGNT